MRHYEMVILIHPDQSEQVSATIDGYQNMIKEAGGLIHRHEDWGRRQLAYPINKIHKAHYVLMNIECDNATRIALEERIKFNEIIIRHMLVTRPSGDSEASPMMRGQEASTA